MTHNDLFAAKTKEADRLARNVARLEDELMRLSTAYGYVKSQLSAALAERAHAEAQSAGWRRDLSKAEDDLTSALERGRVMGRDQMREELSMTTLTNLQVIGA